MTLGELRAIKTKEKIAEIKATALLGTTPAADPATQLCLSLVKFIELAEWLIEEIEKE